MTSPPPRFPRHTASHRAQHPAAHRRFTASLVEMAVLTGVVLRLLRALVLTREPSGSLVVLGAAFAVGAIVYFGIATLHLSNFTVRRWVWRVPAFALIESAAEMATSALLIALNREPLGTIRAEFSDWPGMAVGVVLLRLGALALFALVLAGVVQVVRQVMARRAGPGELVDEEDEQDEEEEEEAAR